MFCPNCGNQISDDSNFCPNCGQQLNLGYTNEGSTQNTDNGFYEYKETNYNQGTYGGNNNYPNYPMSGKSRLAAGLLQIFLGGLGVGRFYLGYPGMAVAQILVTFVTCGAGAIWPFIDGILILCGQVNVDGQGNPLRD